MLVSVDDFKQGTLSEAIELVEQESYNTEAGAVKLIERIWCFEDHCPTPALGFYEGNLAWATERCKADAYSLLGFVYRKRPSPQIARAEMYYKKALELVPAHCEATGYMGELYTQIDDFEKASTTYLRLQDLAESEKTAACTQSLETLRSAWDNKMWCPPPMASRSACVDSASTASASQHSGLVLVFSLGLVLTALVAL